MSCCSPPSGLLGGDGPLLKSVESNGLIMGQVGMSRCLPWGGQVWQSPLGLWVCCITCSVLWCRSVHPLEWAFDRPWHPICCPSHGCLVDLAFPGWRALQLGKSTQQLDGCSLLLTRGYATHWKELPHFLHGLVSGSVQLWQQINLGL